MRITIPSQFNSAKTYLGAEIAVEKGLGIAVSAVSSPLSRVDSYYQNNINRPFDFSFLDERGFHIIRGDANKQIKNLLVLLAYERVVFHRDIRFQFSDAFLGDVTQNNDFNEKILSNAQQTLGKMAVLFPENTTFWVELGIWLYFKWQVALLENEREGGLIAATISQLLPDPAFVTLLEVIYRIDSDFIRNYCGLSYPQLRGLLAASDAVVLLGAWRVTEAANDAVLREAARKVINQANSRLSEQVKLEITCMVNEQVFAVPEPRYLPAVVGKTPEQVAQQILKHYQLNLPDWDTLLGDLGTVLIRHDLGADFLGLFVSNPEAHQSAIFINESLRDSGSHNFTIAHELGHYLLHNAESFLCADQDVYFPDGAKLEQQANVFSVELLMPNQAIRTYLKKPFSAQNVAEMAEFCKVSREAAARRWIQLDVNKARHLAFISIVDNQVASVVATVIRQDGMRWIGRPSIGAEVVTLDKAIGLFASRETRLRRYLPAADADWLQNLEIDVYFFANSKGYYLFIEKH